MAATPSTMQLFLEKLGLQGPDVDIRNFTVMEVLRILVNIYPMVFVFPKNEDLLLEMNAAFADLFELSYSPGIQEIKQVLNPKPGILTLLMSSVMEKKEFFSRLHYFERIDRLVYLLIDAQTVRQDGEYLGTIFIFREISNFVQFETDLFHIDRLSTVGKMAAGIAHEIRNPMTSIRGFMQILSHDLMEKGWEKEKGYTDMALMEIERVNELLNQLLLLAKPMEFVLEDVDINHMVKGVGRLHESEAIMHEIQLNYRLTPVPKVKMDENMFRQVLTNLIRNAMEAIEDSGEVTLSTRHEADKDMVVIDVTDTGPGIPSYLNDRIFDAFFTTKEQGTGLGLAICQRIVHEFGGHLRMTSKGYGTTFSVFLPSSTWE